MIYVKVVVVTTLWEDQSTALSKESGYQSQILAHSAELNHLNSI